MRHIHHMGLVNLDGASTAPCFRGSLYSTTESNAIILIVREEGRGNNQAEKRRKANLDPTLDQYSFALNQMEKEEMAKKAKISTTDESTAAGYVSSLLSTQSVGGFPPSFLRN